MAPGTALGVEPESTVGDGDRLRPQLSPELPAVLTSGYGGGDVLAQPHGERPQAFLAKPFLVERLAEAIGRALASEER